MGIFSKLFSRKSAEEAVTPKELAEMLGGWSIDGYSGRTITRQHALQLTAVFGCIRVLSESVGMLPCHLFEQKGDRKEKAVNHSLYKLLSVKPNDYMTPQEFWELLVACLCLKGNFYGYKVRTMGKVSEILPFDPDCVEPKLDSNHKPVYKVTFKDGSQDVLTQDQIWHVRILTLDGLTGLSPISFARQAISLGLDTEQFGAQLFKNGAVGSGALETDDQLSDEAYKRLKEDFEARHQGMENMHKPFILEKGLKWNQITMKAEDTQFLETRKFQKDEICAIFRVPPHMIANLEKATFSNIEHQAQSFVNYSLMPYLTRIEQRINIGLLNDKDQGRFYAKFNAGALLRGDMKSRFEAYASGIQWSIYSPNDCRELEDLNPREGGDIYLTPMNMTTNPENTENNNDDADETTA
ncbi:portal protein [Endozoicomonas montiporae]|uniref:Portal protein n=2 Tax=Endozoicomonas montiporae TaxID=1027273 RepID=A0A081N312_9GAMM|nr:phage portal protein [Endozoicomonas montiporae]AMO58121.1 portal protein [Endozoicomonas montiporae CL-33]KEQ12835.1 portal protein [Endozoicomonas montiporae]